MLKKSIFLGNTGYLQAYFKVQSFCLCYVVQRQKKILVVASGLWAVSMSSNEENKQGNHVFKQKTRTRIVLYTYFQEKWWSQVWVTACDRAIIFFAVFGRETREMVLKDFWNFYSPILNCKKREKGLSSLSFSILYSFSQLSTSILLLLFLHSLPPAFNRARLF